MTIFAPLMEDGVPVVRPPRYGERYLASDGWIHIATEHWPSDLHIPIYTIIDAETCPIDQLPGWERVRKALSRLAKQGWPSSPGIIPENVSVFAQALGVDPWDWRADLLPDPPKEKTNVWDGERVVIYIGNKFNDETLSIIAIALNAYYGFDKDGKDVLDA